MKYNKSLKFVPAFGLHRTQLKLRCLAQTLGFTLSEEFMEESFEQKVISALEDKRYKWRTVSGIVKQTRLPQESISEVISQLAASGKIVQSSVPGKDGQQLFTTRSHYRKKSPIKTRLSAILRNRGA